MHMGFGIVAAIATGLLIANVPASALAQGSAGGSIGKQGKSASGETTEAPAPPARSKTRRTSARDERDGDSPCRGLAGRWSWSTGGETTIRSSGTLSKGDLNGTWTCKDGQVVIRWSHGYTDRLEFNDGRLSGKNQLGFTITGRRKGAD
jgi:hypothetical protein